ncbi:MAG: GTPase [Candidatus Diapherotrites archaeon]|nr:GTPase [Candidatus Diapherotrites archaeon]
MKTYYLPKIQEWIDQGFRKTRKAAITKKVKDKTKRTKTAEIRKIEVMAEVFDEKISQAQASLPDTDTLTDFEKELINILIGTGKLQQIHAKLGAVQKILSDLKKQHIRLCKKTQNESEIKGIVKKFYGRSISVIKSLSKDIGFYNDTQKALQEIPHLDAAAVTLILAGMPNTGKSTWLAKMTSAKPKIANYPFTTQQLNIGYFEYKFRKIQVIDTPGLLESPLEKRNQIERKAITALQQLNGLILFLIDASEQCGYELKTQMELLKSIEKNFSKKEIVIIVNKQDISSKEQIQACTQALGKRNYLISHQADKELTEKILKNIQAFIETQPVEENPMQV